jgi:hypothetical protein
MKNKLMTGLMTVINNRDESRIRAILDQNFQIVSAMMQGSRRMEQDFTLMLPATSYSWSQLQRDVCIAFHGRNCGILSTITQMIPLLRLFEAWKMPEKPRGVRVLFSQTSPYKLGTYGTLL